LTFGPASAISGANDWTRKIAGLALVAGYDFRGGTPASMVTRA
jgi:hypothetical protein